MSLTNYDYVIIGAGPAGMTAAVEACQYGLNVLVLDEQPTLGGQIYRNIEDPEEQHPGEFHQLGADYQEAFELAQRFRSSEAKYGPGRSIWRIDSDLTLYRIGQDRGSSETCYSQRILIATGAMERPMPFPGWTLPGVLACTAADVLYKSSGLLSHGEIVLLGSGPLLLLIACRLLDAGVKIAAYLDTNPRLAPFQALPYLPEALRGHDYLRKGIRHALANVHFWSESSPWCHRNSSTGRGSPAKSTIPARICYLEGAARRPAASASWCGSQHTDHPTAWL